MTARASIAALALAACGSRTEIVFGIATDLRAPDALDKVSLVVQRVDNGVPQLDLEWDITGQSSQPFNLPGSFGVFSDGDELALEATLAGFKNDQLVVSRRSIVSLIEGDTLFYRMGLTAGCVDRLDCPDTSTCIEGVCRAVDVPSEQLPDFDASLVVELTCVAGAPYLDTGTGDPMPLSAGAATCPAGLCLEGTCLKPPRPDSARTRTVRGSKIETFVRPNKQVVHVPVDLSSFDIVALVPSMDGTLTPMDPSGGGSTTGSLFTEVRVTGTREGTFSIPDVPTGTYVLRIAPVPSDLGPTEYIVTSGSQIDLGFVGAGRPNRSPVEGDLALLTGFTFNVSNLAPWEAGNFLTAYAPDADAWWFFFSDAAPPTLGQTSLANVNLTFSDSFGTASSLIANDDFALVQYTNRPAGQGASYQTPARIFRPASFTQTLGTLTPLAGSFTDVPVAGRITFDVRQLEWEAAVGWNGTNATSIHPSATYLDFSHLPQPIPGGVAIDLVGQPGGTAYGNYSATIDYLFVTAPPGRNTTFTDLTFGRPDVSSHAFGEIVLAEIQYGVDHLLPGTTVPARTIVGIRTAAPPSLDGTAISCTGSECQLRATVTPLLGPIRSPRIDDRDLFAPQEGISATPRLTWQPPALGTATVYSIEVRQLSTSGQQTLARTVARLWTTDPFLDLPPGVVSSGGTYVFVIKATNTGNIDAPLRQRLPDAFASISSAVITIGTGNGNNEVCGPLGTDCGDGIPVTCCPGLTCVPSDFGLGRCQ